MAERSRINRMQAVVLRRRDYNDADRILTVFTPNLGKLDLIAKGIRKTSSRKAGHLELFTHVSILVAQARTWDIITEAVAVESFRHLRGDLGGISRASYVAELIDVFGEASDDSTRLWDMLLLALRELDAAEVDPDLLLRWFEIHLLSLAGFQPELFHCLGCGEDLQPVDNFLSFQAGGIYCPSCGETLNGVERISPDVLKILRHLQRSTWGAVRGLTIRPAILQAVESILYRYLVTVLERQLKSADFVRRLQRVN
ncbi:MAG: DNA repair protein RecO [Caldilineaceae bacterium]|nr:DNA repair protein RecO [Caldilineaceae bacterium]